MCTLRMCCSRFDTCVHQTTILDVARTICGTTLVRALSLVHRTSSNNPRLSQQVATIALSLPTSLSVRNKFHSGMQNTGYAHPGGLRGVDSSSGGERQGCTCRTATIPLLLRRLRISPGGSLETSGDRMKHAVGATSLNYGVQSFVCSTRKWQQVLAT